ncbi:hypothetical protein HMPREF0971_01809 [Segatella oris F0302]|uniref:Uncharacterized protein n=1 Tax=Segatella oris F0302 TaxID=649760 RepID=D1QS53_9BACT|nr:hypothetical protein HMPREF0971_01809 [Segatella oris F0302]
MTAYGRFSLLYDSTSCKETTSFFTFIPLSFLTISPIILIFAVTNNLQSHGCEDCF